MFTLFRRACLALFFISMLLVLSFGLFQVAHALNLLPQTDPPPVAPPTGISMELWATFAAAVYGFFSFWITQGVKSFSAWAAKFWFLAWLDIKGWGSILTVTIVAGALFFVSFGMSFVPKEYMATMPFILELLIAVLTAMGIHATFKGTLPKVEITSETPVATRRLAR